MLQAKAVPNFHVMIKPAGGACNARCSYCFYGHRRETMAGAEAIDDTLLESFIRQYIEGQSGPGITFSWQGGEPTLLGTAFFRKALGLERKYAAPGKRITNTIQTNALLLNDDWCRFLKDNGFLVGVSIDGPRELHDACRRDRNGKATFERVMRGLALLDKHGVPFNTLTVVNRVNGAHPLEVYRFLRDTVRSRYQQFIPCAEAGRLAAEAPRDATRPAAEWSVDPGDYGNFLTAIFDEWLCRDVGTVYVILFDVMLGLWLGMPSSACAFAPACGSALALERDGGLYSCDHYVRPGFRLGRIGEQTLLEMLTSEQQRRFGAAKKTALTRHCRECGYLFACGGDCPRTRFAVSPEGEPGHSCLCPGLKRFFAHIDPWMKLMAAELRGGRPADGVMRLARAAPGP